MSKKIKYIQIIKTLIIPIAILLVTYSCANMGMPEGGPKDVSPPQITESTPENYSTRFSSKQIKITFDEFIVLKNINQALIVSPPLEDKPEIKLKGKTLIINFINDFLENTTYSLNFGNAIVDNNEGNILKNYNYVFSTGDVIDSLSISGKIINSFSGKVEENVLIIAYTNLSDSVPLNERPVYIAQSIEDGSFTLNNLRDTTYKIFALRDANNNYLFDQPNEEIAFSDTLLKPFVNIIESTDTLHIDSLNTDTIIHKTEILYFPKNIQLSLFKQKTSNQYLKSISRPERSKLIAVFNQNLSDSLEINPINFTRDQFIPDYNSKTDSLKLWITDSLVYNTDTILAEIKFQRTDSLGNLYIESKNVKFGYKEKAKSKKQGLKISVFPKNKSKLDLNKNIFLTFDKPVKTIDTSRINFSVKEDSLFIPVKYSLNKDSLNLRRYNLIFDLQENRNYSLSIYDSAFFDITAAPNDSTGTVFTIKPLDFYGNIILNLEEISGNAIIQLFDNKDKLIEEQYTSETSYLKFNFLKPGKYKLKIINDRNNNKEWDTGNYLKRIQPEEVDIYNKEIKVRSNWELEIDWSPFGQK